MTIDRKLLVAIGLSALTAGTAAFLGARAMATGAPAQAPLVFTGTVTDASGLPYKTAQEVVVKFYDGPGAANLQCTSPSAQAEAGTGRFSVVLPPECAQAVHATADLWSEVTVGAGKTVLPRVHVGAVPFALEADSAKLAATAVIATGVQCNGCVKVAAMGFDKDVDLQGHTLQAGKLSLGGGPNQQVTAEQLATLTGGGNADALHTHAGLSGGGGGGQVISYKGLSATKRVPAADVGLPTFDADCNALYPKSRMCTDRQFSDSYPAPIPGSEAYLLLTIGYATTGATFTTFGVMLDSASIANCQQPVSGGPFTYINGSSLGALITTAKGALTGSNCSTPRVAACCGP